jgi:hypothetical protein
MTVLKVIPTVSNGSIVEVLTQDKYHFEPGNQWDVKFKKMSHGNPETTQSDNFSQIMFIEDSNFRKTDQYLVAYNDKLAIYNHAAKWMQNVHEESEMVGIHPKIVKLIKNEDNKHYAIFYTFDDDTSNVIPYVRALEVKDCSSINCPWCKQAPDTTLYCSICPNTGNKYLNNGGQCVPSCNGKWDGNYLIGHDYCPNCSELKHSIFYTRKSSTPGDESLGFCNYCEFVGSYAKIPGKSYWPAIPKC